MPFHVSSVYKMDKMGVSSTYIWGLPLPLVSLTVNCGTIMRIATLEVFSLTVTLKTRLLNQMSYVGIIFL